MDKAGYSRNRSAISKTGRQDMAKRQISAGAVIYLSSCLGIKYLIIKNSKGHWDFPKGHIEGGETRLEACRREVKEETGITRLGILPGFLRKRTWSFSENGSKVVKNCWFYLAKASSNRLKLSGEHSKGGWYFREKALRLLDYSGQRSLIREASRFVVARNT